MKASAFNYGPFSIRATLVAVAVSVLSLPSAFSATILNDSFDYADDAALTAVWSRVSGTESSIFLAPDPLDALNQAVQQTTAAGRLRQVIEGGIVTTPMEPIISFSFDLYDTTGGTASGRVYGEIRNSATASGLLAAGIYNSVNVGVLDVTKYQARALDGGGWIQLDATRSEGWHNFRFEIAGDTANLYVDGVLDPNFEGRAAGNVAYDWVHLGSALSGNTAAYFDNVMVAVVPEPSAFVLGLLGLLLGGAWLRRR